MNPAAEVIAEAVRVTADENARPARRTILSVQGCSACGVPSKQKIKMPLGVRTIRHRLKMTRIPMMFDVSTRHPRSAAVMRRYPVHAPLCKTCRAQAVAAGAFEATRDQLEAKGVAAA